jgi:hypothetical protein
MRRDDAYLLDMLAAERAERRAVGFVEEITKP